LGKAEAEKGPTMKVLVYVNTNTPVGDADQVKVFANADAAETWFEENDPRGLRLNTRFLSEDTFSNYSAHETRKPEE
jgi:hypothetical protein